MLAHETRENARIAIIAAACFCTDNQPDLLAFIEIGR